MNYGYSFASGEVFRTADHTLEYFIDASKGSSGSPVLNWDGEAIAIHNSQLKLGFEAPKEFSHSVRELRGGTLLHKIFEQFFKDRGNYRR